jgi:hypothetical protein
LSVAKEIWAGLLNRFMPITFNLERLSAAANKIAFVTGSTERS